MQDKKQQLEPDMEQRTGSKLGKENVKAIYCHPAYLNYMQSTTCNDIALNDVHLRNKINISAKTIKYRFSLL